MGHFSMEIYAPTGSNLSGNQQPKLERGQPQTQNSHCRFDGHMCMAFTLPFCRRQFSATSFLFASAMLPQPRTKEIHILKRNQDIDFASFLEIFTQQT